MDVDIENQAREALDNELLEAAKTPILTSRGEGCTKGELALGRAVSPRPPRTARRAVPTIVRIEGQNAARLWPQNDHGDTLEHPRGAVASDRAEPAQAGEQNPSAHGGRSPGEAKREEKRPHGDLETRMPVFRHNFLSSPPPASSLCLICRLFPLPDNIPQLRPFLSFFPLFFAPFFAAATINPSLSPSLKPPSKKPLIPNPNPPSLL